MDNISGISIHNNLDESNFSSVCSMGTHLNQILEKLKKLEAMNEQQANQTANGSSSSSMFQIYVQFGELKKEVEKMGQENEKMKKEFAEKIVKMEKKIAEKDSQMREMKDEIEKSRQTNLNLNKAMEGNERALDGLKGQIEGLKEESGNLVQELRQVLGQNVEKEEFTNLSTQFAGMKEQCEKLGRYVREMGEKQTTESATLVNLSKKIANLETRFKFDLIEMKENKWVQCGPKIIISEGELVVKHSGPDKWNCVRAQIAIPKFNASANKPSFIYFEVEILVKCPFPYSIGIGFCTQQFPLEGNLLGEVQNSIGIWYKGGMHIDGKLANIQNAGGYFQTKDMIGIGIVYFQPNSTMKWFASCNGDLLGMADLPRKFAALEIYPAVTLCYDNDSIRANFGTGPFRYDPREILQNL